MLSMGREVSIDYAVEGFWRAIVVRSPVGSFVQRSLTIISWGERFMEVETCGSKLGYSYVMGSIRVQLSVELA